MSASPVAAEGPHARRLNATWSGTGGPVLVLGHGFGTDQTSWRYLRPRLDGHFRVLAYDLACVADPQFEPGDYTHIGDYADDLLALLTEQEITDAYYVGHSVSGMLGILASLEQHWRFRRLILINPSPRYLNAPGYHGGFEQADLDGLYAAMRSTYRDWVAGFAPAVVQADAPEAVRIFSDGLCAMRPDIAISVARTVFQSDVRNLLPAVTVPVDLLHSERDMAVPGEVADYLAERLPDARLLRLQAAGHLPHLSAPEEAWAALRRVLPLGADDTIQARP